MKIFDSIIKFLSKLVFTNRCEICAEVIEFNDTLCEECRELPIIKPPYCEYCGYSKENCICKRKKNEYKMVAAPFYYENSIVRAIHNFKNREMPFLAKSLSQKMYEVVSQSYGDIHFDYITYVPFRTLHRIKRGYNQSQLLADELSKKMDVPCVCLLKKVRYTGVQHKKTSEQRKADIFGAFDVCDKYKNQLDGKIILLVDDVKTTGATLNECAKMLKIYSAKAVYCSVAAITKMDKDKKRSKN